MDLKLFWDSAPPSSFSFLTSFSSWKAVYNILSVSDKVLGKPQLKRWFLQHD